MKFTLLLLGLISIGLTGCNTFEQNIEADRASTTTAGMNAREEGQVEDMADGGQLNSYEEQQMDESISGGTKVTPIQPDPVY